MTVLALILAAFVIGFLFGDRRAVKQFNNLVTEHNDRLERFVLDRELMLSEPDDEPTSPTRH
ncbi:hypothetical protein LB543_28000 [Mesorhizobium sp. ESP7-2]|uniref:hypothetical protein n=1 Tax=Mesorhizobium sp. ESP7-2 TaxID=2876622 RepID=UPI001CCC7D9D|nr:hypothetical protein [Mesorhizobium sp. ESP7-2]MBZ9710545.1 hypothetical protein [Mesorhizobium sp. ESP7-2]